ncbi:MAG: hypothetical protein DA328_01420 [Nitrososphaeraceae archaeon]|nr:hypothetical protein [Nitrososphaeraceae archaeon]
MIYLFIPIPKISELVNTWFYFSKVESRYALIQKICLLGIVYIYKNSNNDGNIFLLKRNQRRINISTLINVDSKHGLFKWFKCCP